MNNEQRTIENAQITLIGNGVFLLLNVKCICHVHVTIAKFELKSEANQLNYHIAKLSDFMCLMFKMKWSN